MTIEFLKIVLPFTALTFTGGLWYAILLKKERGSFFEALFYGWGIGIVLLYMIGSVLIRIGSFFYVWHWILLAIICLFLGTGLLTGWLKNALFPPGRWADVIPPLPRGKWGIALLSMIVFHVCIILLININHPVFYSDAANPMRWVGLAKIMYRLGGLPQSIYVWNPVFPSLIPLWGNMFTARWFDSFAALPWFAFHVSILGISFLFIYRLTENFTTSIVYPFSLMLIPVLSMHVIRPGWSDLIVSYFMTGVVVLFFNSFHFKAKKCFLVSLIFALGACLTKKEGMMWMLLVYFSYGIVSLYVRRGAGLKKILLFECVTFAVVFLLYFFGAESIYENFAGKDPHFGMLFRKAFQPEAFPVFFRQIFLSGGFGLYWWAFFVALCVVLVKTDNRVFRLICLHYLLIFGIVLYYSCFTGNIECTLNGTNVSRLMLQLIPLGAPLYYMFLMTVMKQRE